MWFNWTSSSCPRFSFNWCSNISNQFIHFQLTLLGCLFPLLFLLVHRWSKKDCEACDRTTRAATARQGKVKTNIITQPHGDSHTQPASLNGPMKVSEWGLMSCHVHRDEGNLICLDFALMDAIWWGWDSISAPLQHFKAYLALLLSWKFPEIHFISYSGDFLKSGDTCECWNCMAPSYPMLISHTFLTRHIKSGIKVAQNNFVPRPIRCGR